MFKISKAVLKTLASFHNITTIGSDAMEAIRLLVEAQVSKIIKRVVLHAKKRSSLEIKRLYIDDVHKAITELYGRCPLTIPTTTGVATTGVATTGVATTGVATTGVGVGAAKEPPVSLELTNLNVTELQLHRFPFHKLILNTLRLDGYHSTQVGNDITTLLQNEVEFMLYNVLETCSSAMRLAKVSTLTAKIINHVLAEKERTSFTGIVDVRPAKVEPTAPLVEKRPRARSNPFPLGYHEATDHLRRYPNPTT